MMISPDTFRKMHENDSLEECYRIRRELMNDLIEFEDDESAREIYMMPSPETFYVINNLYLIEICRLIEKKLEEAEE